jgi:hypothetical protein
LHHQAYHARASPGWGTSKEAGGPLQAVFWLKVFAILLASNFNCKLLLRQVELQTYYADE